MIPPNTHELKNHTAELANFSQSLRRTTKDAKPTQNGIAVFVAIALIALTIVVPMTYPQIAV